LKERRCADFSNIHGLTYIPFSKRQFNRAKAEIRKTLVREGLIEA